jgi:outer membrane protein OmpA-like peptidoglycan-associated protein
MAQDFGRPLARRGATWRSVLLGAAAALPLAHPGPASAQQNPAPPAPAATGGSAQELKSAIQEIKRKLEQQRQDAAATGSQPAVAATEDLRTARERVEGLAQALAELRAERDSLRGQLVGARDELGRTQQRVTALESERQSTAANVNARVATLTRDLAAATARVEELTKAEAAAAAAGAEARELIAQRERELAEVAGERDRLRGVLAGGEQAQRELTGQGEELRRRVAELETEVVRIRADAEAGRAELARNLKVDLDAARGRLAAAEREAGEMRQVATSSVDEVRSLSEQLLAALAEKEALVTATVELSSSKALQALQLESGDGRPEPAGGPAAPGAEAAPEVEAEAATPPVAALVAARAEEPAEAARAEGGGGWDRLVLDGSLFGPGSDRLEPEAAEPLARVAGLIKAAGTGAVRVTGHTDANGEAEGNRRLSQRRAQSVRDYLVVTYGFEGSRFAVEGQGEDVPIASNDTAQGRRANRRVEVLVAR